MSDSMFFWPMLIFCFALLFIISSWLRENFASLLSLFTNKKCDGSRESRAKIICDKRNLKIISQYGGYHISMNDGYSYGTTSLAWSCGELIEKNCIHESLDEAIDFLLENLSLEKCSKKVVFGKGIPLKKSKVKPINNREESLNRLLSKMVEQEELGNKEEADRIFDKITLIEKI